MAQSVFHALRRLVNNEYARREWVRDRLREIPENSGILDASCGSQPCRKYCEHLRYYAQDFGNYKTDEKDSLTPRTEPYRHGILDYTANIWKRDEQDSTFDAILCTEVIEHILYPNETIQEFSRLLKPGGRLIITVPANSLHPYGPILLLQWIQRQVFGINPERESL